MNITTISLSFIFLGISFISMAFFLYFKFLVVNTSESNKNRKKIIGKMKNPTEWRERNNHLSYLMLFWSILSFSLFVYIKYYVTPSTLPTVYLFLLIGVIAISTILISFKKKEKA